MTIPAITYDTKESRVFFATKDSGTKITLRVRRATREELRAADYEQAREFNQAMLAGLPPRSRMIRQLRDAGSWTKEDDLRLTNLRRKIAQFNEEVADLAKRGDKATDAEKARLTEVAQQRLESARELDLVRQELDAMLANTAEARAEDAQNNCLLACVTEAVKVNDKGEVQEVIGRVWDSIEALLDSTDMGLVERAMYELMLFNAGRPSEWLEPDPVPAPEPTPEPVAAIAPAPAPAPVESAPTTPASEEGETVAVNAPAAVPVA